MSRQKKATKKTAPKPSRTEVKDLSSLSTFSSDRNHKTAAKKTKEMVDYTRS